ncbi:MAG: dihydrodipicolinate synthase family protein [Chitinispirillia bacterium]|jgi:4-hydroxy-tetrahydrodipicolinate synthase
MKKTIKRKPIVNGVYPTMLTPFKDNESIDYAGLKNLIEWYFTNGIDGMFAVCQSSAMFELSRQERKDLCRNTYDFVDGRCPVIASGHVSDTLEEQYHDLMDMAESGADGLVLVSNRLARPWESDRLWLKNLEKLITRLPSDIPLGLYECPFPYKRLLSDEVIKEMVSTKRFGFVKDTCCSKEIITRRAALTSGSDMKLFNANAATLLFSLKAGYAGYSGVMTNFHTDLYHKLCRDWSSMGEDADKLQDYLGSASIIEGKYYPVNAKYFLHKEGVIKSPVCRRSDVRLRQITGSEKLEIEQFCRVSKLMSRKFAD